MPRAKRERLILEVAGQVFARGGYHTAAMEEIAQLAGVSKPMLYAYFGSKEGLYLAYIDRTGHELLDRLIAAGRPQDGPRDRLRARIMEFLAFVEEYRDGWRVLFGEVAASTPIAQEVAVLRKQVTDEVRRMVEATAPGGERLSSPVSDGIAHAIVGAGESLANWWLLNPGVPRGSVANWYVGLVQAAVGAALHRNR